jgi:hypothetical protein
MSDDLIKRLRDFDPHLHEFEVVDEAADRIEQLERERDELKAYIDRYSYAELADEAEARCSAEDKLAKALSLVEDAFCEGFGEGYDGGWIGGDYTLAWKKSDVKAELEKKE